MSIASSDCPFELNVERYNTGGSGYDHWPGGFFIEVLVHANPQHRFWKTEDLVVVDFAPHKGGPRSEDERSCLAPEDAELHRVDLDDDEGMEI